jgi:HPt (histidine-containing phosphotransfer) domain-containing protein
MDKPAYRRIADKFVVSLSERLRAMRSAHSDENLEEISRLAHWLKGSAGSVGFHSFTEPAKILEQLARDGRVDGIAEILDLLENMYGRIEFDGEVNVGSTLSAVVSDTARYTAMPDVIESSLSGHNSRFQDIVSKFVAKLRVQLQNMELALEQGDFVELASLAHWLKGSAGSVGFDTFTQPAANLETAARNEELAAARRTMDSIREMNRRIALPAPDGTETEDKCTIESS